MKKTLFLFIGLCLLSCSKSPEDILNKNLEAYIKKIAKDPSSYESIETTLTDTLYVKDVIEQEINSIKYDIELSNKEIEYHHLKIDGYETDLKYNKFPELVDNYKNMIKSQESLIDILKSKIDNYKNRITELENVKDSENIAFIVSNHKCRLKNGFGALDIQNYYVITDDKLNIIGIDTKQGELIQNAYKDFINNKFPVE